MNFDKIWFDFSAKFLKQEKEDSWCMDRRGKSLLETENFPQKVLVVSVKRFLAFIYFFLQ